MKNLTVGCQTRSTTLPQLPRSQRVAAAVASLLISFLLLSSVAIGLTSSSDDSSQVAGRATPVAPSWSAREARWADLACPHPMPPKLALAVAGQQGRNPSS